MKDEDKKTCVEIFDQWFKNPDAFGNINIGVDGLGGIVGIEVEETIKLTTGKEREEFIGLIENLKEPCRITPNFFKGGLSSVKLKRIIK